MEPCARTAPPAANAANAANVPVFPRERRAPSGAAASVRTARPVSWLAFYLSGAFPGCLPVAFRRFVGPTVAGTAPVSHRLPERRTVFACLEISQLKRIYPRGVPPSDQTLLQESLLPRAPLISIWHFDVDLRESYPRKLYRSQLKIAMPSHPCPLFAMIFLLMSPLSPEK